MTTTSLASDGPPLRGWMRNVTLAPEAAGEPELTVLLSMRTSAPGLTVVSTVAVLSDRSGSVVPPDDAGASVAVLVTVPLPTFTVATSVTGGMAAPTACGPLRLQVTVPDAWAQVQPVPLADT